MGRKQSQSAEAVWRDRLAKFHKSKLSVADFCRQGGFSDASFYHWRRRLHQEQTKAARRSAAARSRSFVPVQVSASSAVAEIEFPNGVRIRVPAGNTDALRTALEVGRELWRGAS